MMENTLTDFLWQFAYNARMPIAVIGTLIIATSLFFSVKVDDVGQRKGMIYFSTIIAVITILGFSIPSPQYDVRTVVRTVTVEKRVRVAVPGPIRRVATPPVVRRVPGPVRTVVRYRPMTYDRIFHDCAQQPGINTSDCAVVARTAMRERANIWQRAYDRCTRFSVEGGVTATESLTVRTQRLRLCTDVAKAAAS